MGAFSPTPAVKMTASTPFMAAGVAADDLGDGVVEHVEGELRALVALLGGGLEVAEVAADAEMPRTPDFLLRTFSMLSMSMLYLFMMNCIAPGSTSPTRVPMGRPTSG